MIIRHESQGDPGSSSDHFTGPTDVARLFVPDARDQRGMATVVHHHRSAMSKQHSHPGGQYLYFCAGTGRVGEAGEEEVEVPAGTLVVTEPGVVHWHGSSDSEDATVFSVTWGGTEWVPE